MEPLRSLDGFCIGIPLTEFLIPKIFNLTIWDPKANNSFHSLIAEVKQLFGFDYLIVYGSCQCLFGSGPLLFLFLAILADITWKRAL